jgi:hypothetical protein
MLDSDEDQVVVIRLWREREVAESSGPQRWRARITYVNSGQQFHASGVDDAFAVVRYLLGGKFQS